MPSSSSRRENQTQRPQPLNLKKTSRKIKKPTPGAADPLPPVIIYLHSPKVIHVEPRDFKSLVQQLTGKSSSPSSSLPGATASCAANIDIGSHSMNGAVPEVGREFGGGERVDSLVLTLGQLPPAQLVSSVSKPSPASRSSFFCSSDLQMYAHPEFDASF